jgi:hypothetical protein
MREMPTASYPQRTEQNVLDSDGTLILSHGRLTGGSALTEKLAKKHGRPCLHVDLTKVNAFAAAQDIKAWVGDNGVEILNVAGPRASRDPEIYEATKKVLKATFHLLLIQTQMPDPQRARPDLPRTVEEAVDRLTQQLPLKDKVEIAKMEEKGLVQLHPTLSAYVRDKFELWSSNRDLMESCRRISGQQAIHPDDASALIVRELWRRLKETHGLRAVK